MKMIVESIVLISCIKILLIPAYHSTDFEVHRNWLAITHSLPIKQWYFESTAEWTLDYPPLFAWFEYFLSNIARYFDSEMLKINNLNYSSFNTILFQRLSVIVTDLVFAYGCCRCCRNLYKNFQYRNELFLMLFGNAGLLMVDHIHFQYNGILYGILLLSIANMIESNYKLSAFWFAVLLSMKHIYIYIAPAYFIYLLRHFCFTENNKNGVVCLSSFSIKRFSRLGAIVAVVLIFTFGPFYDHLPQVLSRLFPFKRGLCHAYWAPNFWALYNVVDKAAVIIGNKIGFNVDTNRAVMTGGLVQEFSHSVLPSISPVVTFICVIVFTIPIVIKLWLLPKSDKSVFNFIRALVLCAAISFLFGWHVHEKAILLIIIPMTLLAGYNKEDASFYLQLTVIGNYSLFPLLFPENLLYIKVLLFLLHTMYVYYCLINIHQTKDNTVKLINWFESIYIYGFIPLFVYNNYIHSLLLNVHLPFIPLLFTSLYCSVGILYNCINYYIYFIKLNK